MIIPSAVRITREVMRINEWQNGMTRREFTANLVVRGPIFEEWVGQGGKWVDFTRGAQTPIAYWPRRR